MKIHILVCALITTVSVSLQAGTPAQEKAFTDKYKKAFEGKDAATLESFLYTQGADPEIVGFYKMMQSGEAGEKISSIELVNLTPEDEKKDANGSSTSSSENFVAEKDGKFVIPVPGPCK